MYSFFYSNFSIKILRTFISLFLFEGLSCVLSFSLVGYTKERSSIIVIGLNIHTAPVEIREKLAIPEAQWPQVIGELCALNHIEEAAVLSTCNRMEIYVVALSQHRGVKEVTEWMSKVLSCFMYNAMPRNTILVKIQFDK